MYLLCDVLKSISGQLQTHTQTHTDTFAKKNQLSSLSRSLPKSPDVSRCQFLRHLWPRIFRKQKLSSSLRQSPITWCHCPQPTAHIKPPPRQQRDLQNSLFHLLYSTTFLYSSCLPPTLTNQTRALLAKSPTLLATQSTSSLTASLETLVNPT